MCGNILDFKAYFVGKKRNKNRAETKEKSVKTLKIQRFYAFLFTESMGFEPTKDACKIRLYRLSCCISCCISKLLSKYALNCAENCFCLSFMRRR